MLCTACNLADDDPKSVPSKAKQALLNAEKFELFSLDPDQGRENADGIHGWKILGSLEISDAQLCRQIADRLIEGIEASGGHEVMAACFDPRHAIRVSRRRRTFDIVVCFHCMRAYFYEGDGEQKKMCSTNSAVEELLNKVLADAKIPLPRPANAPTKPQESNPSSGNP
jgi:hypothetical protein